MLGDFINYGKNSRKKKLSSRELRFVEFYCSGMSKSEAYRKAGYKSKNEYVRIDAYKTSIKPYIREAIEIKLANFVQEAEDIRIMNIIEAREKQLSLMRGAESETVQLSAAKAIIGDPEKVEHSGEITTVIFETKKPKWRDDSDS